MERQNLRIITRLTKLRIAVLNSTVAASVTYFTTHNIVIALAFGCFLILLSETFHLNKIRKIRTHTGFIKNTLAFSLTAMGTVHLMSQFTDNHMNELTASAALFTVYTIIRHYIMNSWQTRKGNAKRYIYIGPENEAELLMKESQNTPDKYDLVETIPITPDVLKEIVVATRESQCYNIVVSSTLTDQSVEEIIHDLLGFGCNIEIYSPGLKIPEYRSTTKTINGRTLTYIEDPHGVYSSMITRMIDLTLGMLLLPLLGGVTLMSVVLLKWKSPGPIFYTQTRIGKNAETFQVYKYRTMHIGMDKPANQNENPVLFKDAKDPRITKAGSIYRKLSIDELPQLINVLKGKMSLVGPRPAVAKEMAEWDKRFHKRISVKPGMTGLWQVSGRSDLSVEESKALDIYYVEHKSVLLDLIILAKTLPAVIMSKGAY